MSEARLMESTLQFLEEPLLGEQDVDMKVRPLLEAEYLRRLGRYRRLDRTLTLRYGMTFEEFVERRVVQQEGHTWDVEKDAMDWETAVDGMRTMERKRAHLPLGGRTARRGTVQFRGQGGGNHAGGPVLAAGR